MVKAGEKVAAAEEVEERRTRSVEKPDFVVKVRQDPNDRRNPYYSTIGVAWKRKDKNGNEMISVKLTSKPLVDDGSFLLMKPFQNTDE